MIMLREALLGLLEVALRLPEALLRLPEVALRLPEAVLKESFSRLEPTLDPMRSQLLEVAEHERALGYIPSMELGAAFDTSPLEEARRHPPPRLHR